MLPRSASLRHFRQRPALVAAVGIATIASLAIIASWLAYLEERGPVAVEPLARPPEARILLRTAGIFSLMLAGVAGAFIHREMRRRERAELLLRQSNEGLEAHVRRRTLELEAANAELQREVARRGLAEAEMARHLKELGDFKAALDEHAFVTITDALGRITYANDKFCAVAQYPRAELVGQDHRLLNSGHHSKAYIRELWATISAGRVWRGELKNRAKDGTFYWMDTTIVPFLDATGTPVQYFAIRADITGHKAAQAQIEQLNDELRARAAQLEESNRELEAFSYSTSHDLRAPLRHIQSYAELLAAATAGRLDEAPARYLQTISHVAVEMGEMIDHLLAFSRMSRAIPSPGRVDLDALVRDVIRGLEGETKGRRIAWQIAPLPPVTADATLLRIVLTNLIGNAVKYTRRRDPAEIEIGGGERRQGQVLFHVRDNGAGFDPRYAEKLFGVFQRLHRPDEFEGTGIGLATVRRIVARHGGKVWAEGRPDRGATFFFTLPSP